MHCKRYANLKYTNRVCHGGSGMGKTNEKLMSSCPNARLIEGKLLRANAGKAELAVWIDGLKL
ncbi:MAG: flavodoxin [Saccharofermentanales bacterium]